MKVCVTLSQKTNLILNASPTPATALREFSSTHRQGRSNQP